MKYKHIIWDWNGTLINDMPLILNVINSMLSDHKLKDIDLTTYQKLHRHPMHDMYESFGFKFKDNSDFSETMEIFHERYVAGLATCSLQDGATEVLSTLQQQNRSQSVLSALNQKYLDSCIEHHKLNDFFIDISGLTNNLGKSKIDVGKDWIKTIDIDPKEMVVIGDTDHDHEVAEELGADCILVSCGCQSKERLDKLGRVVCENFEQLGSRLF